MKKPLQAILIAGTSMMTDTLNGKKTITIREGHRAYSKGHVLLGYPDLNWCMLANITSVKYTSIKHLTTKEIMDDGFDSISHACEVLSQWYPNINEQSEVTVIRWEK